jgi:acyl dehydratase
MRRDGLTFEQHDVGATFRTLSRTVSETDIVTFVNLCGFTEPLFMDMEYVARESVFKRRAAPGALTFALSEGLIMPNTTVSSAATFSAKIRLNPSARFCVVERLICMFPMVQGKPMRSMLKPKRVM